MFCTMQNKLCLNVRFATGLSPAASPRHMISPMPSLYLNVPVWRRSRARPCQLGKEIYLDLFYLMRFSSFVSLIVCMRQIGCATLRCRRHLGLKFSYIHISLLYIFVDYIHLVAVTPHL